MLQMERVISENEKTLYDIISTEWCFTEDLKHLKEEFNIRKQKSQKKLEELSWCMDVKYFKILCRNMKENVQLLDQMYSCQGFTDKMTIKEYLLCVQAIKMTTDIINQRAKSNKNTNKQQLIQ